jgi:hypothetical protein
MYIIFESRRHDEPKIKDYGKFWFYLIGYIAPEDEASVDLSDFSYTEISEAVANADLLAPSNDGVAVVRQLKENMTRADFVGPTGLNYGDNQGKKEYYVLTDEDKTNCCTLLREIMKLQIANHGHRKDPIELEALKTAIDQLPTSDLNSTQMFMSTYFEFETAYTQFKTKQPVINIKFKFDGDGF